MILERAIVISNMNANDKTAEAIRESKKPTSISF